MTHLMRRAGRLVKLRRKATGGCYCLLLDAVPPEAVWIAIGKDAAGTRKRILGAHIYGGYSPPQHAN